MNVALRGVICSLVVLAAGGPASFARDAGAKSPVAPGLAGPKSTYRSYIEAVRKTDTQAARKCWVLDDDNKSGVLEVLVGRHTALRRLNQVAVKKFGKEGARAITSLPNSGLDGVTDQALDLTSKRLDKAVVKIKGDTAVLKIKWLEGDGTKNSSTRTQSLPSE
jgi:hypothetical protein